MSPETHVGSLEIPTGTVNMSLTVTFFLFFIVFYSCVDKPPGRWTIQSKPVELVRLFWLIELVRLFWSVTVSTLILGTEDYGSVTI